MQFVYFPDSVCNIVPGMLSSLYTSPDCQAATLKDVAHAIEAGNVVTVRPASETELKRAESYVALFEIGQMLGRKIETLLDQEPESVVKATITNFRDAMESVHAPFELIDREPTSVKTDRSFARWMQSVTVPAFMRKWKGE